GQLRKMLGIGRPVELLEYHVMSLREALWHNSSLASRLWDELLADPIVLSSVDLSIFAALCDSSSTTKIHQQTALDLLWPGCQLGQQRVVAMVLFLISKLGNAAHVATFNFVSQMWTSLVEGVAGGALFFLEMIRTKAVPKAALASIVKFSSLWELCKDIRAPLVGTATEELLALEFLDLPKEPLICTTRSQAVTACRVVSLRSASKALFSWDTVFSHLEADDIDESLVGDVIPLMSHGTLEKLQHWGSVNIARLARLVLGVGVDREAITAVLSVTTSLPPQAVDRVRAIICDEIIQASSSVVLLENVVRSFPGKFTHQIIAKCVAVDFHDRDLARFVAILGEVVDDVSSVSDFFIALLNERDVDKEQVLISFA
ncbi:MAG: hypothetical protein Q8J97_02305, partial [Flavobacteriaceae bacterium]|nr:hypothetical protein [Flavobacteriaceae bacterium]